MIFFRGYMMNELIKRILKELNIDNKTGLASDDNKEDLSTYQRLFYTQAKDKIGIDAVYFLRDEEGIAKIPLIYFSMMNAYDATASARLHCLSWNMGEAPLLFVVTPTELKIYNNYETPRNIDGTLDPEAGLIDTISLITDLETQRQQLRPYNRSLLESGEYWRRSKNRFDINNRIDITLMNNLKIMRRRLINMVNSRISKDETRAIDVVSIVHGLLSRSILIKYLEERKDSNGESVFPKEFYAQFCEESKNFVCNQYTDVLENKEATYKLFNVLESKFNGDMLPLIDHEYEIITEAELRELKAFLIGDSNLESQQLTLWPLYDFNIIPIQIISSIYELFFHLNDADEDDKGTYYTPLYLVDTLLDEVYPWEGAYEPIKIVDPSCGSGIFLVEAYRRIVCRWMQTNNVTKINNDQLTLLLQNNIYGVDINEEAVRIASFSLSLALCDFLDPRSIWDDLSFPKLVNTNLVVSDFFAEDMPLNKKKFDIVIGNPPWQSQLTAPALEYLVNNEKTVGDKQIAQAFSIKCAELCKETGAVCLLMPSKGLLFNRSKKSVQYRKTFFEDNTVSVIINFSIYRKFLFDHASGPAAAVIYSPVRSVEDNVIFYCTPKPQFSVQDSKKFSIDPNDICKIPRDMVHDDRIWKIAMWGSPRDLELIDRLQSTFPDMESLIESNEMCSAEGYKRGNRSKECEDFLGMPYLEAKTFSPFYISEEDLPRVDFSDFECLVTNKRDIFKAPHLVIKQSHKKSRFLAAVLDYDAVFNHSLLGIHGDVKLLKYLCIIVNSKLFSYYHMLTNRKWLVERDELEAGDIWSTPIPNPRDEDLVKATQIFDSLISINDSCEELIQEFICQIYRLQKFEMELIKDSLEYIYNYFDQKTKSIAFETPSESTYIDYYTTMLEILQSTLGNSFFHEAHCYIGDSPLTVLALLLTENNSTTLQIHTKTEELKQLLDKLDSMLTEERQNLYIRRNVRIYGKDAIYIIKPKQKKYWNYSSASRDADEIFTDIMKTWRTEK